MALLGNIREFNESSESFSDYADRVDSFFAANDIADEKQTNVFLSIMGASTFKLCKNLCSPGHPKDKSYAELRKLLKDHFAPAPITIAERFKFWTTVQGEQERVSDFIVRLKTLASTCDFGNFLTQALRDKLVTGLNSKMSKTQTYLLTRIDLTFDEARTKCLAREMADSANMCQSAEPNPTHRLKGEKHKPQKKLPPCKCCGRRNHEPKECFFKDAVCHECKEKGHIRPNCPKTKTTGFSGKKWSKSAKHVESSTDNCDTVDACVNEEMYGLNQITSSKCKPYLVTVQINDVDVKMEVDTGASRSTISEHVYRNNFVKYPLQNCRDILTSYSGQKVPVLGCIKVKLNYNGKMCSCELIVVKGPKVCLLGRDLLNRITLDWKAIFKVSCSKPGIPSNSEPSGVEELLAGYKNLFETDGTGIKEFRASVKLKPNVQPVYQKSRPVPYSIKENAEREYDRLIKADILYEVEHSNWASPAVHVPKADKSIRVCGDYKAVNELIEDDGYKLPTTQDLFVELARDGQPKVFSVLDLVGAFNQLFLDEESAKLLVINTHRGLLATKRLCFGIKTAPSIFQATMDKILSGLEHVFCYIDDVLIATNTIEEHMTVLKKVLERFEKFNVRLNKAKCQFLKSQIKFLGHVLSAEGVSPVEDKVSAIKGAPRPTNVSELKSFVGMLNYYGKFVPDLSSKLSPLYALLHHATTWRWTRECENSFQYAKNVLSGDNVLVHYDKEKELVLSVDASPYGLGAILSHKLADGTEKPIAYASRTLSSAEKNYAQIEREGLAIVFGVKKFHLYLYGRSFLLVTDHKPLTRIFGPKSGIPPLAAARMQRWALLLSGYQYKIEHRSSSDNANADMLSRLPMNQDVVDDPDENYIFHTLVDSLPVTAKRIADQTRKDSLLVKVLEYTLSGWSESVCSDDALRPYWSRRDELSVDDGCLMWGRRVVVPSSLQDQILLELHECHPGMCRMKALARGFVWWPGIDEDIENVVRMCALCTEFQNSPKKVPLLLWPWATSPWERIHVDFLEVKGQNFLLVVDSYSKWLEVFPMNRTTSSDTIEILRTLFARYGMPLHLVSDNGPQFISAEFKEFLHRNQVKHTLCPPYHPASNGLAEKYVQTFKRMFGKLDTKYSLQHRVSKVLFNYRNIPHSTTGISPGELFLKRSPRTPLSLVKPCLQRKVENSQAASKKQHDGNNPVMRTFDLNQPVKVKNARGGKVKWLPGVIVDIKGPSTYLVRVPGNSRRFVHADHLIPDDSQDKTKPVLPELESELPEVPSDVPVPDIEPAVVVEQGSTSDPVVANGEIVHVPDRNVSPSVVRPETVKPSTPVSLRRSSRVKKVPQKLDL